MSTETEKTSSIWKPVLGWLAAFEVPMLALSGYVWSVLPADARIATHWDIHGQVNGYSSKGMGLFLMPAMLLVLVPFVTGLTMLDPRKEHVAQSRKFLLVVLVGLMAVLGGCHMTMLLVALGYKVPMDLVVLTLVGGLFAVMGNYLGKVRSNFFMGVRTPWTLSSELSWNKTNRLFGRFFVVTGVLTVLLAWTGGMVAATVILIAGSLLSTVVCIPYSYVVWKSDPSRVEQK